MSESLQGKVAVISGVGSGFAKATAELFARKDKVGLVMFDIDEAALSATASACKAAGSRVAAFKGDATKPETFTRALKEAVDGFGKVDFLINYAGGAVKVAPIEEMDDAVNRRIIDLNLMSAIMSCRTFAPQFKKQGYGKIDQCFQRLRPPLLAGLVRVLGGKGRSQRVHEVPLYRASAARHCGDAPGARRREHWFPEGRAGGCEVRLG